MISKSERIALVWKLFKAMRALHSVGKYQIDFSPSNIMICGESRDIVVKILESARTSDSNGPYYFPAASVG